LKIMMEHKQKHLESKDYDLIKPVGIENYDGA
jgi:hypothetical protein